MSKREFAIPNIMNTTNIQRWANSVARAMGYGKATEVVIDHNLTAPTLIKRLPYGYRKITTGEYVPNAYRNNFGWKNTYYQSAVTVIGLPHD